VTPQVYAIVGGSVAILAAAYPWWMSFRAKLNMDAFEAQLKKLFAANNPERARKLMGAAPWVPYLRCMIAAYDACIAGDWPAAQRTAHARAAFNDAFRAEAAAIARRLPLLAVALAGIAVALWAVLDPGAPPWTLAFAGVAAMMVLTTYRDTRRLARDCPAYAERIFPPMTAAIVALEANAR
jgi:hypothetical protein